MIIGISYVLFVLSSGDFYPKVTHLATFYRGDSGYEDIDFKDLNLDNKEEIIVTCNMKDFLNVMIFHKNNEGNYHTILDKTGAFKGNYLISDVLSDNIKEIEVFEYLAEDSIFSDTTGPFLSKRSVFVWEGDSYYLYSENILEDAVHVLNDFLKGLMIEGNLQKSYDYIIPDKFFKHRAGQGTDYEAFVSLMDTREFSSLLVKNKGDLYRKKILGQEDISRSSEVGWEESISALERMPSAAPLVKSFSLKIGNNTYFIDMEKKDIWRISNFKLYESIDDKGWIEVSNENSYKYSASFKK